MVREVEFSNLLEIFNDDKSYSDGIDQEMFTGVLSDSGKLLTVTVGKELPEAAAGSRKILLYYGNVDFDNKFVDYVLLEEKPLDNQYLSGVQNNKQYEFDISKVLIIPRKVYNTQGSSEIVVQLYTYEANVTTDYGDKRLSVPYSIESNTKFEYDNSTDGIFRMYMVDFPAWAGPTPYYINDIVCYEDILYKATTEGNLGNAPTTGIGWEIPTEEDIIEASYATAVNPPLSSVITDSLISRYAKYNYILNALINTEYKSYDNKESYELVLLLQAFRERAMFNLLDHKSIDAAYALQQLKLASSSSTDTTKVRTTNIKYTI